MPQCVNCFEQYIVGDSPELGYTRQLYCSPECAETDEARLSQGNAIIDSAFNNNEAIMLPPVPQTQPKAEVANIQSEDKTEQDMNKLLKLLNLEHGKEN